MLGTPKKGEEKMPNHRFVCLAVLATAAVLMQQRPAFAVAFTTQDITPTGWNFGAINGGIGAQQAGLVTQDFEDTSPVI
jgi:hypothetical protein